MFYEDAPILDLALDPTDNYNSLWVATTDTSVSKWPVDPNISIDDDPVNGADEEEDPVITDVDDPTPYFSKPHTRIPGTIWI